jgi:hypothetical protein
MHKIKNYGLMEVESLDGAVKVQIQFDNGLWWEGFLNKKDGTPNKATLKTLFTCGFRGTDILDLIKGPGSGVLNESKKFDLTTETEIFNDKTIEKVKWVNDPEASRFAKAVDRKKVGGAALAKALQELNRDFSDTPTNNLKNHAPTFQSDEEIPF